jgi:hypothetical protein
MTEGIFEPLQHAIPGVNTDEPGSTYGSRQIAGSNRPTDKWDMLCNRRFVRGAMVSELSAVK